MIDNRTKGLHTIHGFLVLLILPFLFLTLTAFAIKVTGNVHYSMIRLYVYLGGILGASLIFFNSHKKLRCFKSRMQRKQAFSVTNTQVFILSLVLFSLIFATKDIAISRLLIGSYICICWFVLFALNLFIPVWLAHLFFHGKTLRSCVVVGSSQRCKQIEDWLLQQAHLGFTVVGFLSDEEEISTQTKILFLGKTSRLIKIIKEKTITQVILLETQPSKEETKKILQICEKYGCRILAYNPWVEYFDHPLITLQESQHSFFTLKSEPLENPVNRLLKRVLDVGFASFILLFIFPFLTLFVFLLHRKQAPGPIFFKQKRLGLNRKVFTLYKFRTMYCNTKTAASEAEQAHLDDDRVFPLGKFLRHTSIDEFPQFINVLKGEMSVVGPRPHFVEHDYKFSEQVQNYSQRHFAKPGITGLAQAQGYRGEITTPILLHHRTRYDLAYIDNWSLWLDVEIILKTIWQILHPPKQAY